MAKRCANFALWNRCELRAAAIGFQHVADVTTITLRLWRSWRTGLRIMCRVIRYFSSSSASTIRREGQSAPNNNRVVRANGSTGASMGRAVRVFGDVLGQVERLRAPRVTHRKSQSQTSAVGGGPVRADRAFAYQSLELPPI